MNPSPAAPNRDLQEAVLAAFRACFPTATVCGHDDFFDLGGDSLKALSLCLAFEEIIGTQVHPSVLFRVSTPCEIATYLSDIAPAP